MVESEVRALFGAYLEALNAHEFRRLPEFVHDEILENGIPVARDEVVAKLTALGEAVPDFTWRPLDVVVDGSHVAARMYSRATHVNEWLGVAPTGRTLEFAEYSFHEVRDGRFCAVDFLIDVPAVLQQMGS